MKKIYLLTSLKAGDEVLLNGKRAIFRRLSQAPLGAHFDVDGLDWLILSCEVSAKWVTLERDEERA